MVKVLVFGSFDVLHKGHEYFFEKAKMFGDELIVVVARDDTILDVKGRLPKFSEGERAKDVEKVRCVDKVVLGFEGGDKYKIIQHIKPDVIALGYDQDSFSGDLKEELKKRGLSEIKIVRLDDFKPDKYKSSLLKEE